MATALVGVDVRTQVLTPSVGADDASSGSATWSNPGNVGSTSSYATATVPAGATSHNLAASSFNWGALPAGARITGMTVTFDSFATIALLMQFSVITSILSLGSIVQNVTASLGLTGYSFGETTDDWGGDISPDSMRDNNFAVNVNVTNNGILSMTSSVRNLRVTVSYQTPIISGGVVG